MRKKHSSEVELDPFCCSNTDVADLFVPCTDKATEIKASINNCFTSGGSRNIGGSRVRKGRSGDLVRCVGARLMPCLMQL